MIRRVIDYFERTPPPRLFVWLVNGAIGLIVLMWLVELVTGQKMPRLWK